MLLYFENFFLKLINLIIYLYSFIESKYILLKKKYFSHNKKTKEIYYFKNRELLCTIKKETENNALLNYDKKLIVNYGEELNYAYIYENENNDIDIKTPLKNKNFFLTIDININEQDYITRYSISLNTPLNFYFTKTHLLCYEHVYFLMKHFHNIEINKRTNYEISLMDNNFKLIKINSEEYVEFNDDGNYEIKKN
jgi:hypothetical protein